MSLETNPALRRSVIYELYVRSHTPQGTFRAVEPDLPRIRALGTDILWLMPIHPIGEANRKGSMGCPYANRDYRTVNPEYGTLEDFLHLVDAIHDNGMKCIIDVVYNHTSPDATLVALHPEYYYHKPDGSRGNKVGDWTDVVDLDYAVPGLWDYQIESLCYWAQYVDGFRCDVASTVPVAFWRKARQAVERVRPGAIWLGESVHLDHILAFRRQGFYAATDNELFDVFDILYPYDIWPLYEGAAGGTMPLSRYFAALSYQELSFPTWYNKLSCLENHDQRRAADRFPNRDSLLAWTALSYFQKGTTLLYAGQEVSAVHTPSLFEREPIDWTGEDLSPLLRRLYDIKKRLPTDAAFHVEADDEQGLAVADYRDGQHLAVGVFPLAGRPGTAVVPLADGGYENAALVSRSREGNTTCAADTSVPGTYYYFCVVENSLGDDTKTTKSNMIEVVVQEKTVEKTIEVNLPSKSGLYEITVYVDGVLQYGPASVSITDDRSVIVEVTVRGKGTLPVDVYLDGAIYDSQLILFE